MESLSLVRLLASKLRVGKSIEILWPRLLERGETWRVAPVGSPQSKRVQQLIIAQESVSKALEQTSVGQAAHSWYLVAGEAPETHFGSQFH